MVHIPVLNIEVPEVRLAHLIPEAVNFTISSSRNVLDTAMRVAYPIPQAVEEAYVDEVIESFPREFQRVFRRGADCKHKNEDQLSSELEDAAFDYYRRMIRTSVVGATEEDQEDVTAYKLGLDRPSIRDEVWEAYRLEHGLESNPEPGSSLAFEHTPEERAAIESTLEVARKMLKEADEGERQWQQGVQRVKNSMRSGSGQTIGTVANGMFGLVLGMAVIKGAGLLVRHLGRLRAGSKAGKGKGKPKGPPRDRQHQARIQKDGKPSASTSSAAPATSPSKKQQQTEASKTRTRAAAARKR